MTTATEQAGAPRDAVRGKVESNEALRAYVDQRLRSVALDRLAQLVRERFGPDAPGYTGLRRYIKRRRRAAAQIEKESMPCR